MKCFEFHDVMHEMDTYSIFLITIFRPEYNKTGRSLKSFEVKLNDIYGTTKLIL